MKRLLLLAGVFCLTFASLKALASSEDHFNDALSSSMKWVSLIDAGNYDDSYASSCNTLQEEVPADRWNKVLRALRGSWGAVVHRQQISHVYQPDGYGGESGEFMVITYATSFKKLPDALEVVVLKRDGGKWRGAGYNAGAKPNGDATAPTSENSATEVNTQMHVKPNAQ